MNFFKGYLLQLSNVNFNKNIGLRSIEYFNKAILFQADFPLPYWQLCNVCLLYTSDAADERSSVDLGGRRIIKKKKRLELSQGWAFTYKN